MAKLPSGWILIPKPVNNGTAVEIEQRELITCKDCVYFVRDVICVCGEHYDGCYAWEDDGGESPVEEDWFCSKAERREDALEQSEI